jgi:hypothetical protein
MRHCVGWVRHKRCRSVCFPASHSYFALLSVHIPGSAVVDVTMLRINARGAVLTSIIALILVLAFVAQWKRHEIDSWRGGYAGGSTPDLANQDSKLEDVAEFKDDAVHPATPVVSDFSAGNSTLGVRSCHHDLRLHLPNTKTTVPSNPRPISRNQMASRRSPLCSKSRRYNHNHPPTTQMERTFHKSLPRLRTSRSPRRSNGMARPPRPP